LKKQGRELLGAYRKLLNTSDSTEDIDTTGLVAGKPGIPTGPLLLEVRIDSLLTMVTSDTLSDAGQKLIAGIRAFQCGDYDKAVREFKKTLASYPSGPIAVQCLYDIGVSYFKLRLLKEAENQFQQILDRYPTHELAAQSSFLKALAYSEQKETVVAEQLFREFLLSHRGHRWEGKAWEKLGDTYVDLDQPKKAIDAYAQAAGKTGNFEDQVCAWYKTGNAFALIGNSVRACAAFDSAIALGERHKIFTRVPDSYYRIADEKYKSKEYTGAQTYYEAVIRKFPDFQETPWAIFQIGNVHKNLQQFKEAIESYNDLIKNYPEDYWAKQAKWKLDDAVWEHEYQTALH
jgi:tetratricopeptide (TPR) repeat protein